MAYLSSSYIAQLNPKIVLCSVDSIEYPCLAFSDLVVPVVAVAVVAVVVAVVVVVVVAAVVAVVVVAVVVVAVVVAAVVVVVVVVVAVAVAVAVVANEMQESSDSVYDPRLKSSLHYYSN